MPPPAIGPEWSAGRRECPQAIGPDVVVRGEGGNPLANLFEEDRLLE